MREPLVTRKNGIRSGAYPAGRKFLREHLARGRSHVRAVTSSPGLPFKFVNAILRRLGLVMACAVLVPALCLIWTVISGPRFVATALVKIDAAGKDVNRDNASNVAVDPTSLLSSQARLLQSRNLAKNVVGRLGAGADTRPAAVNEVVAGDEAANAFQKNLSVHFEARSYLIEVSYRARTPDEAARMANAAVAEYLHMRSEQLAADRLAVTDRALDEVKTIFGSKHPKYISTQARNDAARKELVAATDGPRLTESELARSGFVVPAIPDTTSVRLNLFTLLAAGLSAGLGLGLFIALLLEHLQAPPPSVKSIPKLDPTKYDVRVEQDR